ncbi:MAG: valine--tRNA ligase, partial [Bacteroidales bacterium]|nr:valine--tRNA ligase [Bacteroidales bacterium]
VPELDGKGAGAAFMVGTTEFFLPLEGKIDTEEERKKIEAEIARYEGFLRGVNAKLGNAKFVANAPEAVVEMERKKQSDATTKLENLKERLAKL